MMIHISVYPFVYSKWVYIIFVFSLVGCANNKKQEAILEYVNKDYEEEFLYFLDWGTTDHETILALKNLTKIISDMVIELHLHNRRDNGTR